MDIAISFAIIALAGLIHASFQLSVSMLTLLSGHSLGKKTSHARVLRLSSGFIFGAFVSTLLIVSFLAYLCLILNGRVDDRVMWSIASGLMIGIGIATWVFYYRHQAGTSLWIPRGFAQFIVARTKSTRSTGEAFSLGSVSIFAELLFIIAPALGAGLALAQLPVNYQLAGAIMYALVASLPLIVVYMMVGGGHKLSRIQRWRENNKRFLQFAAGSALLILGFFIYVNEVLAISVGVVGALTL